MVKRAPHVQVVLSGLCPRVDKQQDKVPGYNKVVGEVAEGQGLLHVVNEPSFKYQACCTIMNYTSANVALLSSSETSTV